jgi:hypothetical protein
MMHVAAGSARRRCAARWRPCQHTNAKSKISSSTTCTFGRQKGPLAADSDLSFVCELGSTIHGSRRRSGAAKAMPISAREGDRWAHRTDPSASASGWLLVCLDRFPPRPARKYNITRAWCRRGLPSCSFPPRPSVGRSPIRRRRVTLSRRDKSVVALTRRQEGGRLPSRLRGSAAVRNRTGEGRRQAACGCSRP